MSGADGSVVWSVVGARREGLGERIYAAALPHVSDFEYVWVEAPGVASNGAKGAGYPRLVYGKTGLTVASVNPYANKVKK